MAGQRPTPTKIKMLRGNPGLRPLNPHEPQPPVGMPDKPATLDAEASAEWDRMGPLLVRLGVLTISDGPAFIAYCTLVGRLATLRQQIADQPDPLQLKVTVDGSGQEHTEARPNPLYRMELEAMKTLSTYLSHFGLTPATRSKIVAAASASASRDDTWAA